MSAKDLRLFLAALLFTASIVACYSPVGPVSSMVYKRGNELGVDSGVLEYPLFVAELCDSDNSKCRKAARAFANASGDPIVPAKILKIACENADDDSGFHSCTQLARIYLGTTGWKFNQDILRTLKDSEKGWELLEQACVEKDSFACDDMADYLSHNYYCEENPDKNSDSCDYIRQALGDWKPKQFQEKGSWRVYREKACRYGYSDACETLALHAKSIGDTRAARDFNESARIADEKREKRHAELIRKGNEEDKQRQEEYEAEQRQFDETMSAVLKILRETTARATGGGSGALPESNQRGAGADKGSGINKAACDACRPKCSGHERRCRQPTSQRACYQASACMCQCFLNAGGCGMKKADLQRCVRDSNKRAAALRS